MKEFDRLSIRNLNKSFGNLKVLNNFNLELKKGEFVSLLGPSGCGKSTALNCISGLLQITKGEIYCDDECVDDSQKIFVTPEKRGFGIVFQNYALFPHLNVYKNVAFSLEIKKVPKKRVRERVEEALKMVHLEGYKEKYPSQLSGGQQQRVAIARCIIMEPGLLLLDEPLSNLDAKLRIEMRSELRRIHERLMNTTIYVTHDQQEALALSDRIVVMKTGNIQQIGTPEEIYSNPGNIFVADFMGYKNMWPAKIKQINRHGTDLEYVIDVGGTEMICRRKLSESDESKEKLLADAYRNNEEVTTAIRPDDFAVGEAAVNNIRCKIDIIEYLGTTNQVNAVFKNGLSIEAKHAVRPNERDEISYNVPPEKIAVFPREEVKSQ